MNEIERRFYERVCHFIEHFHGSEDVFLHGCCYWFAFILRERFGGSIMYDPVAGHFMIMIGTRLFDVRGDVTDQYDLQRMDSIEMLQSTEPNLYGSLMRCCRYFEEVEDDG